MNYFIKRFKKFKIKNMFDIVNRCHEKSDVNKLVLFFDMIYCAFKYKSGYADYEFLEMYNVPKNKRKYLVTVGKNDNLVKMLNPKQYWNLVDDKYLFNERFKNYLGRDYMLLNDNFDDFEKFVKDKKYIIVKPVADTWGNGVEKITVDHKNIKKLYNKLINNKQILIEEVATQHKDIAKLHPKSINTIRVISIRNNHGVVTIIGAVIRMGTGNSSIDNFHSGGIYAPIDIKTGKINGAATNKKEDIIDIHPTSKIKLIGYQLPCWEKVMEDVVKAHNKLPELGYIGWDVYVTEDGKIGFIEANQYPGHVLYKQMKMDDGNDIMPLFDEALKKTE